MKGLVVDGVLGGALAGWNRFVSVGQLKKLKPLKGGVVMDCFREGEGPPVFFIEVAVMITQQKALNGNAVSIDAC